MGRGRKQKQREHKPHEIGPRLFRRGRWYGADLRPWSGKRVTLRNPKSPGWPDKGERTDVLEVAEKWRWHYVSELTDQSRRSLLGLPAKGRRLAQALDDWLEHREHTVDVRTWQASTSVANRLRETFGPHRSTATITTDELQQMFFALLREGYQRSTLSTERSHISTFFTWIGGENPVSGIVLPRPNKREIHTWTDAEMEKIRTAADAVDAQRRTPPRARLAVELAVATGMRQQELFAAPWRALDRERRTIRITRQLDRMGKFKALKGKKSRTAVVLPSWWEWHDDAGDGLILAAAKGVYDYRASDKLIQRILDTANLNGRGRGWHDFRRTFGRLFLEGTRGSGMHLLQQSLGHSSIKTTEDAYGHLSHIGAADIGVGMIYGDGTLRIVR